MRRIVGAIGDPLRRLPLRWRVCAYVWLAVFFARLAVWYGMDSVLGEP